jgi:hypothetical protein
MGNFLRGSSGNFRPDPYAGYTTVPAPVFDFPAFDSCVEDAYYPALLAACSVFFAWPTTFYDAFEPPQPIFVKQLNVIRIY